MPPTPPPPPVDPLQTYDSPEPAGRKPHAGLLALAGVAAVGALLAGLFAVTSLTAADGASSPEDAVENLFDAVNDEDAVGALESLAPGEREMLVEPLQDIQAELVRLNVTSEFDLEDVPGVDLETADLELQTVKLTDDISRVEVVGGTLSATTVPNEAPAGSVIRDQMDEDDTSLADVEPDTETVDFADEPLKLVAIKRGGSWHVSIAYSIAEAIRADNGGSFSLIGQGPEPVGSDSPEAAVRDMADAITQLPDGGDEAIEHLVTLLPPDELGVAYDYLPVWLSGDDGESDDSYDDGYGYESSSKVEINDLALTAEGDGSTRRVRVDGFSIHTEQTSTWTYTGEDPETDTSTTDVVFDGECIESTSTYTSDYSGNDDPETDTFCKGDVEDDAYGDAFSMGFSSIATWSPTLTVVEVDGRWYVSPVRTVFDSTVETLRAMTPEDLQKFIDEWSDGFSGGEQFESVGPAIPGDGSDSIDIDPLYEQCSPIMDDVPADASDDEWNAAYDAYSACLDGGSTTPTTAFGEPQTPTTAAPPAVDPFLACDYIIDALPPDASPDEIAASREAYEACFEENQG